MPSETHQSFDSARQFWEMQSQLEDTHTSSQDSRMLNDQSGGTLPEDAFFMDGKGDPSTDNGNINEQPGNTHEFLIEMSHFHNGELVVGCRDDCKCRKTPYFAMLWPFLLFGVIIVGAILQNQGFPRRKMMHNIESSTNGDGRLHKVDLMFLRAKLKEHVRYFRHGPQICDIGVHATHPSSLGSAPAVFRRYLDWHAKQMNCLRNPTCYNNKKDVIKIVLWKCPENSPQCSGTGESMQGMIGSLALAMITKRVFILEWPQNPYPFSHAVSPAAIDWRLPRHVKNDISEWGRASHVQYHRMEWVRCPKAFVCYDGDTVSPDKQPVSRSLATTIDLKDANTFAYFRRIGNFIVHSASAYSAQLYRRPEWAAHFPDSKFRSPETTEFQMDRYLLQALFKPSPFVRSIIDAHIFPAAQKNGYFSIHARTGEDVGESNWRQFKVLHEMDYNVVAERFMRCAKQKGVQANSFVYFASESMALKSAFMSKANRNGINVIVSKLPTIHDTHESEGKGTVTSVHNLLRDSNWILFINTFVEFFAVSNSTSIISNRSEFAKLAYILSSTDNMNILNISDGVSCI